MGSQYVTVRCLRCSHLEKEAHYAPEYGIKTHKCPVCGLEADLEKVVNA